MIIFSMDFSTFHFHLPFYHRQTNAGITTRSLEILNNVMFISRYLFILCIFRILKICRIFMLKTIVNDAIDKSINVQNNSLLFISAITYITQLNEWIQKRRILSLLLKFPVHLSESKLKNGQKVSV